MLHGTGQPAFAQDESLDTFDVQKVEVEWAPGERYNPKTGVMDYSHTDLYLPGNGKLPIEIKRVFSQLTGPSSGGLGKYNEGFGSMGLAIPKLTSVKAKSTDGDV